jgi:predicted RNase H-like HicB family nuclease
MLDRSHQVSGYAVEVDGKPSAYGVVIPECPGCYGMGDTVEQALQNASEALVVWLAATKERHRK